MRTLLFILVALVGLTAAISGMLMIAYPAGTALGLSTDLLRPTSLKGFIVPGMVLTIVGIINIAAVFASMHRSRNQYNWSLAGGGILCIWIITQMVMIQLVNWLSLTYLFAGILIILLSYQLKGKWAA